METFAIKRSFSSSFFYTAPLINPSSYTYKNASSDNSFATVAVYTFHKQIMVKHSALTSRIYNEILTSIRSFSPFRTRNKQKMIVQFQHEEN